jgi:signal transduction histidine kinase
MAPLAFGLQAQTPNVDSLINVLETQKLTVKEKLDIYKSIVVAYKFVDFEKTKMYVEKGLMLAQKENNSSMAAEFCIYLGQSYRVLQNDYDSLLIWTEQGLDYAIKANEQYLTLMAYNNIGTAYLRKGKNITALEYFFKMLDICEKLDISGIEEARMMASLNIGSIYRGINNTDKSIFYFENAANIAEEINDYKGQIHSWSTLATIYTINKKDYEKALVYANMSLEASIANNYKEYEGYGYCNLGRIYDCKKDYEKALDYANKALNISNDCNNWLLTANSLLLLADTYCQKKQYKECLKYAEKAWVLDSVSINYGGNVAALLIISNMHLGNHAKAQYYLEKYTDIVEEESMASFQNSISDMETKYETEKKEMRIAALEKEKTFYTGMIIISAVAAFLAFGILFFRHKLNVQKRKQVEQQIKQFEQEKQLVAAQAIIDGEAAERSRLARDLHDGLGGMLSVVKLNLKDMKGYSILDHFDIDHFNKAMDMLDQSIGELRRVAHHIMPESLMRYGLKTSLDDFCHAIPGAHFQFFGDDTDLDNRLKILIYRCAYELLNNAVKHASATNINAQLMIENGLISFSVHDDGAGFDPEKVAEGSGLENVRVRVASYNGKMNIYSSPGKGTEVSIEIEPS